MCTEHNEWTFHVFLPFNALNSLECLSRQVFRDKSVQSVIHTGTRPSDQAVLIVQPLALIVKKRLKYNFDGKHLKTLLLQHVTKVSFINISYCISRQEYYDYDYNMINNILHILFLLVDVNKLFHIY